VYGWDHDTEIHFFLKGIGTGKFRNQVLSEKGMISKLITVDQRETFGGKVYIARNMREIFIMHECEGFPEIDHWGQRQKGIEGRNLDA